MKQQINDFVKNIKNAFWYIVVSSTMFILVGYYLPKIYVEYFDTTKYYEITIPIIIEKNIYKPCEKIRWIMHRKALINMDAMATTELVLMKGNEEVYREQTPLILEKGEYDVSMSQKLPCDLEDGDYFFRGIVTYHIDDSTKRFVYYTNTFNVEASVSASMSGGLQ
jgi:hypothetical protein